MPLLMIKLLFLLIPIYLTTCLPDNRQSPIFVGTFTEQIVERGIRLSLKCSAKGNPLPQITWKQDDQPINEAYHIRIGDYVSDVYTVNSYVNISSTKTDDGGFYSCRASNIAGNLQHTARINVLGPPYIRPMANLTVLSAQNIQITCPYSGYPIKSVTWLRDGRKLPQNHRQKVFPNGTFVINSVEKGADAGQYQCAVTDEDGRTAKRDLFINVVVQPFSFPVDLVSGRRAGVACIVSAGDLPIRITWLKDGVVIPESLMPMVDTKDFTSFLTFDKVSRSHRGNYTCLAENPASTSNYTAPLIVQVPPSWIVEPKDKSVIKGNSLTLDCQADGSPRPIIRWKKSTDGEDFKVVISNAHIQTLENGSLTIREVAKEDAGHYMCQAMNGIGPGASMVVKVTVAVAAHFEKKFETHTVKLGQDLTIRCIAVGDKDIQITWSRDRKLINSNNEPRYIFEQIEKVDRTESIFKIRSAERRDSSLFTCHAENNYGKDNSNFQIVVQESPDCPVDLKAEDIGSRSFALTWSHPFNGNSPILSYLLEYKPSHFYSYSASKGSVKEVLPVTGVNHVIKGLEPQTTYLVTLSAQNGLGTSSECLPLSVTTDGEAPTGAPRDIKVVPISSTSLQVNWKPPAVSEQNGPILGYYVGYRQQRSPEEFSYKTVDASSPSFSYSTTLSSLSSIPSPASSSLPSSSLEDKNFEESCQINGLRKLTRYLIIVQAYNKKGASPPSDQIEAQTLEYDPPEAPTLKVVSTTFNSALLSWDINDDNPLDPMSGYIVYHKVEKGDWEEISIYADKLKYNIKNLSCGKRYQFYIVPFNSAGKGQPSEVVSAKTLGTAPIAPDLHDLLTVNSTFALINLTSWTSGGCPILNFNIQYKVKHSREYILVSTNIIPDQRMVVLSDLSPATWYNVFITAHNEAGSTGAEYTFGTLTASGEPIPYPSQENLEDLAHQLKIVMPLASALVVLTLILGVICAMFKKRQNFHATQHIPGDGVACDGNKSCESMPLSDWDNTAKRHSLRNSNSDEPTMDFFSSTNNLKGNRHLTGIGVATGGPLIPSSTPTTGSTINESIYFPSPYALSRISAYERSLNNEGRSHPQHQLIVNGAPNSHTYDVPHKKCLINPGNPNHGTYWDKINPRNIV